MAKKRLSSIVATAADIPSHSGPGSRSDAAQRPGAGASAGALNRWKRQQRKAKRQVPLSYSARPERRA